jgi:hypothetical protein
MDRDLNDDTLKLVRYKILFVKRDSENAFGEQEELVSGNMDASAFTARKIEEFLQKMQAGEVDALGKLKDYDAKYRQDGKLIGLDKADKKYLRVFYEVLERYPREKLKCEEDQLKLLRKMMPNEQEQE